MCSEKIQRLRIINFVCKTCIMQINYGDCGEEFQFKDIS